MATELQDKLARNIIKNAKRKRPLNKKELLVAAGYDVVTATASPGRTIAQKGVVDALEEYGFDPDSAKRVVKSILNKETAKDEVRLKAADMIFEVHGTYAPVKSINVTVDVTPSEPIKQLANELLELQRQRTSASGGVVSEPVGGATADKERGGEPDRVQEEEIPD